MKWGVWVRVEHWDIVWVRSVRDRWGEVGAGVWVE